MPNAESDPEGFDAVHSFAVARKIVTIFGRSLRRTDLGEAVRWSWGAQPIRVEPRWNGIGAWFTPGSPGRLRFGYYEAGNGADSTRVHMCQSFEVVAHEAGHAVLEALRPGMLDAGGNGVAMHEAFADLTAIFRATACGRARVYIRPIRRHWPRCNRCRTLLISLIVRQEA